MLYQVERKETRCIKWKGSKVDVISSVKEGSQMLPCVERKMSRCYFKQEKKENMSDFWERKKCKIYLQ